MRTKHNMVGWNIFLNDVFFRVPKSPNFLMFEKIFIRFNVKIFKSIIILESVVTLDLSFAGEIMSFEEIETNVVSQ